MAVLELVTAVTAGPLLTGLLVLLILFFLIWSKGNVQKRHYPTGPWCVPLLGHLPFFGKYPPDTFARWYERYGVVYSIKLGSWRTVVINGYERIKEACEKEDDAFSSRPPFFSQMMLAKLRGSDSLAFGPFSSNYLFMRKVSFGALRMFTHRFSENTEKMIIQESLTLVDCLVSKNTEARYIGFDVQHAVGTIMFQLLFGVGERLETEKELLSIIHSTEELKNLCGAGNALEVLPWLRFIMPWKVKELMDVIAAPDIIVLKQIENHRNTFCKKNIRDITDVLLETVEVVEENTENRNEKSMPMVLAILSDLLVAGFETSNQALQWILLYMACYPDVQQRVQEEVDSVLGSRNFGIKDRSALVFTEATMYEVMRKTALVPLTLPKYTIKNTNVGGYDIDKDTAVILNFHSVLFDKFFWKDPENFRPERFIAENNELDMTKCNRVLQFGIGRRRCIGEALSRMELLLMFATMMQRCSVIKPDEDEIDLQPVVSLVYCPRKANLLIKER